MGHYTQVCLTQPFPDQGQRIYTCWIPSKYAVKGKYLRIDDMEGRWLVHEVYNSMDADKAEAKARDYLKQRQASDI